MMRALARFPVRRVVRGGHSPEQRHPLPLLAYVKVSVSLPMFKGGYKLERHCDKSAGNGLSHVLHERWEAPQ
jgi:hypothetical protein